MDTDSESDSHGIRSQHLASIAMLRVSTVSTREQWPLAIQVIVMLQGKMVSLSSSKMKALLVAVVIVLYVYLLIYFKTIYLRTKRLDEIMGVALKTERELLNVDALDKKLAMQMAHVDQLYEDY